MDEWDDFLAKRSASTAELDDLPVPKQKDEVLDVDLGEYVDNAEVFIQVSRGESLTHMREGIFINQSTVPLQVKPPLKQPQKLPVSNLPVANSLSDLIKLLPGHPRLSHPLGQMMVQSRDSIKSLLSSTVEVDSLALFFYGAAKDVKVESDCKIDYSEAVEFKKTLIGQSLLDEATYVQFEEQAPSFDDSRLFVSLENLRLLCGAIPPYGKTPFLIPFKVNDVGQVDLTASSLVSDFASGTTVEALIRLYRQRLEAKVSATQFTTRVFIGETQKITVSGQRPLFNVNLAFRGAIHPDAPYTSILETLFSRQPNYHAIVEAESGLVSDLKIYVPCLDLQAKVYNLLALLADRLPKLPANKQYFLLHVAGTPHLKILEFSSENGSFDCNLFKF